MGKWLLSSVLLLSTGCAANDTLTVSELRRVKEAGYDVYSCILTRGIMAHRLFGTYSTTIWMIVPKDTPVKVTFNDCDVLKLE